MTTSKVYDIIFWGGAHIQEDFRKRIRKMTETDPHPHVSAIKFAHWLS